MNQKRFARRILLIGLPGSGKTSHAEHLAIGLGLTLIKTSTMLRQAFLEGHQHADIIKKAMDQGDLVENQIVAEIVANFIKRNGKKGFVVDGYPRTVEQLKFFNPQFEKVIYLNLLKSEAEKRLLKRGREDDSPKLIKKRLLVQGREINGLKNYYLPIWSEVDAARPMEIVYREIFKLVSD